MCDQFLPGHRRGRHALRRIDDNSLYAITQATQPDLTLSKYVNFCQRRPGQYGDLYPVLCEYRQRGDECRLTDTLPAGLTLCARQRRHGATYSAASNTLSWSLGTLAMRRGQLTFQALVAAKHRGQHHQQSGGRSPARK